MTEQTRVGFVGLGRIGFPVARNIARAGHDVQAYDLALRDDDRRELVGAGATIAASAAEVVAGREIVVTLLPDSSTVAAFLAADGVRSGLAPGAVLVEMSSGYPTETRRIAGDLERIGVSVVDAPICSGGVGGAYDGTLAICVGGQPDQVARIRPVLEAAASDIVHTGEVGSAHVVKLLSNYIALGTAGLMSEVFALGEAAGFTAEGALVALRHCVASRFVDLDHLERVVLGDGDAGRAKFRLALARKDLRYAAAYAAESGVVAPITQGTHELFLIAERTGFADAEAPGGPWRALRRLAADTA